MEISFKEAQEFFYTGVHPSGYHLARKPNASALSNNEIIAHFPFIIPNVEDEQLVKTKVSLTELYMDIEDFKKTYLHKNEKDLMLNDDFVFKLVNKYGLLEGTMDCFLLLRRLGHISVDSYDAFMEGEIFEGLPSLMFNDETFSESYQKKEELKIWIWVLNIGFTKVDTSNKTAQWTESTRIEDRLISNSFPRKSLESNKITLNASCLGTAYLFFRYSKNLTETKRCLVCEKLSNTKQNNDTSNYWEDQIIKSFAQRDAGLVLIEKGKSVFINEK